MCQDTWEMSTSTSTPVLHLKGNNQIWTWQKSKRTQTTKLCLKLQTTQLEFHLTYLIFGIYVWTSKWLARYREFHPGIIRWTFRRSNLLVSKKWYKSLLQTQRSNHALAKILFCISEMTSLTNHLPLQIIMSMVRLLYSCQCCLTSELLRLRIDSFTNSKSKTRLNLTQIQTLFLGRQTKLPNNSRIMRK